jgi:cytochrome c oxidase cbb3-type subunit 3
MSNYQNEDEKYLLNHEYDGIKECDYPLPRWWVMTFVVTVGFAIPYFIYYQILGAPNLRAEYAQELKQHEATKEANKPKDEGFNVEKFNAVAANAEEVKKGEEVFVNNCVACHKEKGQGDIGPNLADEFWINKKGTPEDIHYIVTNGVEVNGMPVWKDVLSPEEIYYVTAYVKTLKGLKLPGAKEPQGNKVEE